MKYGIDLGTTYSCISYVDFNGEVKVVPNAEGQTTTPSVVEYVDGRFKVGIEAKNEAILNPKGTVEMIKRKMGVPGYTIALNGKKFTPEEISARILKKLVDDANDRLSCDCHDAVVTVPAYFGEAERAATAEAAKLAKINLIKIIDEPTASAISYQYRNPDKKDQFVLVYDLGGGTFDISLVHLFSNGGIKVVRHDGKKTLGGKDWDAIILQYCLDAYCAKTGANQAELFNDAIFVQKLTTEVEEAKKRLTDFEETNVVVKDEIIPLTREKFDSLTAFKVQDSIGIIDRMLSEMKESGKDIPNISQILMVGGSTFMPQVGIALRERFPNCRINQYKPNEAVSRGAAIYAADLVPVIINAFKSYGILLTTEKLREKYKDDQTDYSDGLKDPSLNVFNVIRIHEELPQEKDHESLTTVDNQKQCLLQIVENTYDGDCLTPDMYRKYNAKIIGTSTLMLSGKAPKETVLITHFSLMDATGLEITGTDTESNHSVHMNIQFGAQK